MVTHEAHRPTQLIVDGYHFNGIDDNGVRRRFEKLVGWHSGAGVDVTREQRIVDHGEFAQSGHRRGKVLALQGGRIEAPDRSLIQPALDELNAVLAGGGFGMLEYVDRTAGSRWTTVQLLVEPDVVWDGGPIATFQVQFLQTDPYKYGEAASSSTGFYFVPAGVGLVYPLYPSPGTLDYNTAGVVTGIATVSNPGTADAPAVFTVEGPTPVEGFTITAQSTGRRIIWLPGEIIPAGSSVVLDGTDGSVTIDGTADRGGSVIVEAWPVVSAGGSEDFLFTSEGAITAAELTASVTATYW